MLQEWSKWTVSRFQCLRLKLCLGWPGRGGDTTHPCMTHPLRCWLHMAVVAVPLHGSPPVATAANVPCNRHRTNLLARHGRVRASRHARTPFCRYMRHTSLRGGATHQLLCPVPALVWARTVRRDPEWRTGPACEKEDEDGDSRRSQQQCCTSGNASMVRIQDERHTDDGHVRVLIGALAHFDEYTCQFARLSSHLAAILCSHACLSRDVGVRACGEPHAVQLAPQGVAHTPGGGGAGRGHSQNTTHTPL